ncbi:MAG: hypothetical protein AAGN66_21275 [Acidobacteriota bacterium]
MRVIDLSRRPFLNRRPVVRLAAFLWTLGVVLLLVNAFLFGSYWRGTAVNRDRLSQQDQQIAGEQETLDGVWRELRSLDLDGRNARARYLNRQIERRTFPWSALFDHLEEVTPIDIYLVSVKPQVRLAGENTLAQASTRSRSARTTRTARTTQPAPVPAVQEETDAPRDRVLLTFRGVARTDEAMLDFIDILYAHPSFLEPNLSRESRKKGGNVSFNVTATYLTPLGGVRSDGDGDELAPPEQIAVGGYADGEE